MARWRLRRRHQPSSVTFASGAKLTSPDGLNVVAFPPAYAQLLSLYGISGTHGALYRSQPNVRAVVDFMASEVAGLTLKLYEKVATSQDLPTGRLERDDHKMQSLLNRPSPRSTRSRLWKETVSDILVYDVAYWLKVRLRGTPAALLRVPPVALRPERDPISQRVVAYVGVAGQRIELSDLVIFPGYDPETVDGHTSPLETLRRVLSEEQAAGRNREWTWANATRKDGVVSRPETAPRWTDEQREAWRVDWESAMSGDTNAGRVGLLEDGMVWAEASWSPKEMEYLGARMLTRKETSAAFRVDPRLVFAADDPATKDVRTGFYVDRLMPFLTALEEEIDLQLLPDFESAADDFYTEFDIDHKMRGNFVEEAAVTSTAVGGPWMSVDEGRARFSLPPAQDPDANLLYVPLNSARGGGPQASPQSPVATPGPNPAPSETTGTGTTRPGQAATEAAGAKARVRAGELAELRNQLADARERFLKAFYERQRRSVRASGTFASDRWDRELSADLKKLALEVTAVVGTLMAAKMRGKYDRGRTEAYWDEAASAAARTMNAATAADLADKDVDHVFDTLVNIAAGKAHAQVNRETNWAIVEAGHQNGDAAGTKTWLTLSGNPRASHSRVNGETVPIYTTFSNGMQYPGDPSAGVDEVAGCTCALDVNIIE